jgi:hypothetical protein
MKTFHFFFFPGHVAIAAHLLLSGTVLSKKSAISYSASNTRLYDQSLWGNCDIATSATQTYAARETAARQLRRTIGHGAKQTLFLCIQAFQFLSI